MKLRKKFIGDKKFYKMLFMITLPIVVQNGISNFVNLLDNIMVGQTGTEQMSGVAVANQLIFVFNICIFGIVSGAGIFGAQFYGCRDRQGFRNTFRFKLIYGTLAAVAGILIFWFWGETLIGLFLHDDGGTGDVEITLYYGMKYLKLMLIGLPAFVLTQAYTSSLREMGKTVLPMRAGMSAIMVNMVLNYVLIFGKFGAPKMGVAGAAVATVISRFVEVSVVLIAVHRNTGEYPFIQEAYQTLKIPGELQKKILVKGSPLILNEALWACGMAVLSQSYSTRGLAVVAGINISSTISNVFNVLYLSLGNAVGIIVGQLLGAGKMEEARETDTKLIAVSMASCVVLGSIMILLAPWFPKIYNTTDEVRGLAVSFIISLAVLMPFEAFCHACYFTLRSGGQTIITMLFDSVYLWLVSIPVARFLTGSTVLPITTVFFFCQALNLGKCMIGLIFLKKGVWLRNIVAEK